MSGLAPGQKVDRYVVEARLGASRLGSVWRVRHRQLGTLHALKVLARPSSDLRDRLLAEGRVMATLQHPNAVACTDVLDVDGQPALLVDLVEGDGLLGWARGRPLGDALEVVRGVLSVLDAAHARGIVHRDLQPDTILVGGAPPTARVADFGLAKALYDVADEVTGTGLFVGTPAYTAPEQSRDAREVDGRADLFSLGAVLYELVCERRAFPGDDPIAVMRAVQDGRFTPLTDLRPDLPPSVVHLVHGALEPDPARRFASAAQMTSRLERAIADCRRLGVGGFVRSPPKWPWVVGGCVVVGGLGLAGLVVAAALGVWVWA